MRGRNWVVAGVLVVVVIAAATLAGHSKPRGPRPRIAFGAKVEQLGATGDLVYTNAWVAGSGTQFIGVYAGSQMFNRQNGLFVILRQTRSAHQRISRVVVHGTGAVTLLRPAVPANEAAALTATLRFVTASGSSGTLDLSDDSVSLSR